MVNVDIYGDEYERDLAMAIGDTFELDKIHAYQLADMCDECGLPRRQVANTLKSLCSSLSKAANTLDYEQQLIGDELDFAKKLLANIKAGCEHFRRISEDLPHVEI